MRDQGRLTDWDDDKGFGFVTPEKGGLRAFVHIRAFSHRTRRPRTGDIITYQLTWDPKGRPRAENVLFREKPVPREAPGPTHLAGASLLVICFFAAVIALVVKGQAPWPVVPAYVVMSLVTFCAYAFDKSAAMNRRWRTAEQTLHLLSLLGGWPGALIAQRMFHHKSKKVSFQGVFWLIVLLHFGLVSATATGYLDQTDFMTRGESFEE
jgi:uncharacterized membrane protein YsdA (DUF1294 family)/cold shock CspA family protein